MNLYPCSREKDISVALKSGQWPDACDLDLRAHVEACARCSDLVLVTRSMQEARANTMAKVRLEPPGVIWWRAQLRRRQEAVERIGRPMSRAQGFALVVNLLLLVWLAASQAKDGARIFGEVWGQLWQSPVLQPSTWPSSLVAVLASLNPILMGAALGLLILVGGVAFFVATEK